MIKLKRKLPVLLITLLTCLSFTANSFAYGDLVSEQASKLSTKHELKIGLENKGLTPEEIEILKVKESTQDKIAKDFDIRVGKIMDTFLKNENAYFENLAVSVEKADKISTMYSIIEVYNHVTGSEQQVLRSYFKKYSPYAGDEYLRQYSQKNFSNTASQLYLTSSYTIQDAVDYAYNYWGPNNSDYNTPTYPDLADMGGDCANFVSQALYAGGHQMDSTWYLQRKNTTYITPQNISQFNYSWDTSDPSPWISAVEFNSYWNSRANSTQEYDDQYYIDNCDTIFSEPIYRADAVQILKKKFWWYEGYHTLMITEYGQNSNGDSDFLVTYHTTNRQDRPLSQTVSDFMSLGGDYKVKFFLMTGS